MLWTLLPLLAQAAETIPPDGWTDANKVIGSILALGIVQIALAAVKWKGGNGHCKADSLQPLLQAIAARDAAVPCDAENLRPLLQAIASKETTATMLAPLMEALRQSIDRLTDGVNEFRRDSGQAHERQEGALEQIRRQTDRRRAG